MEAATGLATEERGIETAAPAPRPAWRFRLRLGTLLALVLAAAPVLAVYARVTELNNEPDEANVVLLAIVLPGIAVGAWRRASPAQVIAQIGLTLAAFLALLEVSDGRLVNYWLALVVAVTIVLPLLVRGQAGATHGSHRGSPRIAWAGTVLLNVAFNLFAFFIFVMINGFVVTGQLPISLFPVSLAAPALPVPVYSSPYTVAPAYPQPSPAPVAPPLTEAQPAADTKDSQEEHP
jgi:hypothetical protein